MNPAAVYPIPQSTSETSALFFLLVLVAVPVYLLVYQRADRRGIWGPSEMVAITVLFMLTLPLAAMMAGIAMPLSLWNLSVITLVQNVALVGLPAYVAIVRYRLPLTALGLRSSRWVRWSALGAVAAAVVVPLATASEHLAVYLLGLIEGPAQAAARAAAENLDDPLQPVMDSLSGIAPTAWFLILLAVAVPIGEEVFFRGFVYGGLRNRWGVIVATLGSAAFFAAVHMQIVHGLPIFILGLVLALLYERTRSLVPAMVVHALNNVLAVISIWRGWGF
jgi:membrane protease YdiL (CAAX protease family)